MGTRIVTWNLQGRERPDLDAVADHLVAVRPDVVALQEVQRRQALRLAAALGWWVDWRFKHWPVVVPAEGLALLAPDLLGDRRRVHLAAAPRWWSSRRRIAVAGTLATVDGPVTVACVHLGAGVAEQERLRQARLTIGMVDGAGCVAGDLNTGPRSTVMEAYAAAGLRDAWDEARPGEPGATGWREGSRDQPPNQRLDHVLVTDDLRVVGAELPAPGEPGFERFAALSDHLPLVVEVARR